jgi:hypothetical protein
VPDYYDPPGRLNGVDCPACQLNGGASEVFGKGLCGGLFGSPPARKIELFAAQQRQKIDTESPVKQRMEDEVGEVTDAIRARAVTVMVRIVCQLLGEIRRPADSRTE